MSSANILNVSHMMLSYDDASGVQDNPFQRAFDYTRRYNNIAVDRPASDARTLAPGEAATIFDGTKPTGLIAGTSTMALSYLAPDQSQYALTAADGAFRTARAPTGIASAVVAVNNNSLVTFDFTGATLTGVQVGDIMRISSQFLYDAGPYAFNPLNAGLWIVIGIAGTKISAVRPVGESFSGVTENVAAINAGEVQFYSAAGVQKGDKLLINSVFSPATQRVYEVLDVTPTRLTFVSGAPLPEESGLTYTAGSIVIYTNAKRFLHIEADQDCVVRLNGDTGDFNRITPIATGDCSLNGWLNKWGDTWSCVVVNKSVNPMKVKVFLAE